ncbi:MAG: 2-succinyl-5-enolpyruvyl-6-hydroxy-3-cyclohexene-1-carboxylic-acid synthase [Acidobacteriota bacterium]|nr:2-succinyl-5-enolpyruvyl-6-hydroxy-3-cyclohexene-1-carboxylic-acid synthase [Acidobacteriota bacterium]
MTKSVPTTSEVQATYAATLVDEWVRAGVRDVVICPGSRSTPLAVAFATRRELRLHVRIDERSAGFFALGRALESTTPVAILVTSGTAAAELHACVAEADQADIPLLVVTADRPPELHGVGAPQTINQSHLYGDMVRCYEEPGVAREATATTWRALASRLVERARGGAARPGPVHLNAAFVEPFLAPVGTLPAGRDANLPWRHTEPATTRTSWRAPGPRILAVVGRGTPAWWIDEAREHDWVVLGDATSVNTLAHFDGLLRAPNFATNARPDVVVRVGGLPASKVLLERWRSWSTLSVGFRGAGFVADPEGLVREEFVGLPTFESHNRGDRSYVNLWSDASRRVEAWLIAEHDDDFVEPNIARAVVDVANERGTALILGSSMPVRDVEWWASARRGRVFSNRGVSGIDGVTSTALGVASGTSAIALEGDVTMLHDVSALVDGLGPHGGSLVVVVVNNRGGGIFSFLAQAALESSRFETLFATPRPHDVVRVSEAFGHLGVNVESVSELRAALDKALSSPGLTVVVAHVPDRDENVATHQEWNDAVVELMGRP